MKAVPGYLPLSCKPMMRNALRQWRALQRIAIIVLVAIALGSCAVVTGITGTARTLPPVTSPYNAYSARAGRAVSAAEANVQLKLPTTRGAAAPVFSPAALHGGLGSQVVLGFLPSWESSEVGTIDYGALSEVAFYALQLEPEGALLQSGSGWQALSSGTGSALVADAHAAGTRALLTVYTATPSTIDDLALHPGIAGRNLARSAAALTREYGFDGVDLDIEGQEAGDQKGFTRFVSVFSRGYRQFDSQYSVVLNTLPQAAMDPATLYDVKALAPLVDQIFVMAYDMSDLSVPGSASALTGSQLSDATVIASYLSAVPASKLLLGIPFYGYDFPTARAAPPQVTIGQAYAVTYDSIVAAAHPVLWNPSTETPYTLFRRDGLWHETDFEDPLSVALKVALAGAFKIAGVGAWDLGMAAGQSEMTTALDGGSPVVHEPLATAP